MSKTEQPTPPPSADLPEQYVLAQLLERSPEFVAFYQAERPKIPGHLQWAQDSSLPRGIDHRSTRVQGEPKVIRLRRVPAVLADAFSIAHELQHLVLDTQGYPLTGGAPNNEDLSSALNSMLQDPLVNSRLRTYGFDLRAHYQREAKKAKRSLASLPQSATQPLERMHWTVNYVGLLLEWRVAYDNNHAGQSEFHRWFDARYPDIAREAKDLLSIVDTFGFDTPEKHLALFSNIITTYRLGPWVVL